VAGTVSNPSIPDPELVHGIADHASTQVRQELVPLRGAVESYQPARAELDTAAAGFEQVRAWLDERRARTTDR
jgi:hypothetical protein